MKTVEMHVPNKGYDGYYGGVRFHRGVGVFEDVKYAKDLAERYGYEIVEGKEEVEKVEEVKEEKPAPKKRTRKKAEPKAGE